MFDSLLMGFIDPYKIQVTPDELMKNWCANSVPGVEIALLLCSHDEPLSDRHKHTAEGQKGNTREQGTLDTLGKEGGGLLIPNNCMRI